MPEGRERSWAKQVERTKRYKISHRDVINSLRNIVNNTVIILYSDGVTRLTVIIS